MAPHASLAQGQDRLSVGNLVIAFIAGFLAVLVFHQAMLGILHAMGLTAGTPYPMAATRPLGVPQVFSLAFWGGIWGLVYLWLEPRFPTGRAGYWLGALVFGAVGPTLVAWFVVAPLKGLPVAAGWHPANMAIGPLVNGAWGIGTGVFLTLARRLR